MTRKARLRVSKRDARIITALGYGLVALITVQLILLARGDQLAASIFGLAVLGYVTGVWLWARKRISIDR